MIKSLLKALIFISIIAMSCNNPSARDPLDTDFHEYEEEQENLIEEEEEEEEEETEDEEGYQDGTYCAIIKYYYYKTGSSSEYTLPVEIEDNLLTVIHWPNGGWLDDSHFDPPDISNGDATFTTDDDHQYSVSIIGEGNCSQNRSRQYQEVQTTQPQSNYYTVNQRFVDFYSNDEMYNPHDLKEIRLFNKPFCIMQDYYDLFVNASLLQQAQSYYFEPLLIHHNDQLISSQQAINKDIANFAQEGIESFKILVQPTDMITDFYEYYDISSTSVNFYILKNNGKQLKLSRKMYFVLNKTNTKIYGISSQRITQKNVDDVMAMINRN